jgi:hypothetical protein
VQPGEVLGGCRRFAARLFRCPRFGGVVSSPGEGDRQEIGCIVKESTIFPFSKFIPEP